MTKLDSLLDHKDGLTHTKQSILYTTLTKRKTKTYDHFNRFRKSIDKIEHPFMKKTHESEYRGNRSQHNQFSSVAQSCPALCDPMDYSMPSFPVCHQLLEFDQTQVIKQVCYHTISSSVIPFFSCLQSFPASGSFPINQFFASGGQSIGASA